MALVPTNSKITTTDFSELILEKKVFFKVIRLQDSFFIWIGIQPQMMNMAVAMPTASGAASASLLFGNKMDISPSTLAQKLAKKYKKQFFISCSIPFDQNLSILIEKRIAQEMAKSMPALTN